MTGSFVSKYQEEGGVGMDCQDRLLLLAIAKREEVRMRSIKVIGEVHEFIWLKAVAIQMIDNFYSRKARKDAVILKKEARSQCLSENVTPDKYLRQKNDIMDYLWKRDFVIYANGDWFPHEGVSPSITPPKSPTMEPRKKKNKKKNNKLSGKTTPSVSASTERSPRISFEMNEKVRAIHLPGEGLTDHHSPTKSHDGPRVTNERALGESIELWYDGGFTKGDRPYSEFWNHPKVKTYKEIGHFADFGRLIKDAINRYDAGGVVMFKSSSPFKMNESLKSNLEKMYYQYSKVAVTNPLATPFIMPNYQ